MNGRYIVIEGSDGIGKTTQTRDMLVPKLRELGISVQYAHEPGGTPMGEEVEKIVKNRRLERNPMTNLLLFTSARVEAWDQLIKPLLDRGTWVIADRSWLSSIVYQGYAGKLGAETVFDITRRTLPDEYLYPDMTLLAYASSEQQIRLLEGRGESHEDYFESQNNSFQEMLRNGYAKLKNESLIRSPKHAKTIKTVSFDGNKEEVHDRVLQSIADLLPNNP